MRVIWIVLWIALFLGVLPLILAFGGMLMAELLGCDIAMNTAQQCVVLGADIGPMLLTLVMMHWFAIVSLPIAGLAVIGLVIMGVITLVRGARR